MQLRPYQLAVKAKLYAALTAGHRSVVLVAPTASGKTVMAASVIHDAVIKRGRRCIFLAHRRELITQCSEKLDWAGIPHGIIAAGFSKSEAHVQVCSIQTLLSPRAILPTLGDRDLLVIDECHRAHAGKLRAIYKDCIQLGLTATPCRVTDGKPVPLNDYQHMVVAATPSELLAVGAIVPLRIRAPEIPDVSRADIGSGDYNTMLLSELMNNSRLINHIIQDVVTLPAKQTVIFAVDIAHGTAIRDQLRTAGIPAEIVTGSLSKPKRDDMIDRFRRREYNVLVNADLLIEGWDYPELERVIMARPTKSLILYLQQIGRGVRPAEGKTMCEMWDYAGNVLRHGDPYETRPWSLTKVPKKNKTRGVSMWRCKSCFCVVVGGAPAGECPYCGAPVGNTGSRIKLVDGQLHEYDEAEMQALLEARKVAEALENYAKAQHNVRFKQLFGIGMRRGNNASGAKGFAFAKLKAYESHGGEWSDFIGTI